MLVLPTKTVNVDIKSRNTATCLKRNISEVVTVGQDRWI